MTIATYNTAGVVPGATGRLARCVVCGFVTGWTALFRRIVAGYERRRAIAELSALSDELLRDIGLRRMDIPMAVRGNGPGGLDVPGEGR